MAFTKEDVLEALRQVRDPELHRDVVALGAVKQATSCDGHVRATLELKGRPAAVAEQVRAEAEKAIRGAAEKKGERLAQLVVDVEGAVGRPRPVASGAGGVSAREGTPQEQATGLPGVKRIVAVGAGKGGVGKSTIAVNLAVALAREGLSVGIMDGDIYGPSLPTLLGLDEFETNAIGNMLQPFAVHGVKAMTLGKLVDADKPLIWRGPMAHGAFKQLATQTQWGELDYLIIDLPPGTGDVSLTMAQMMRLTGAVIVCTPQKVAQDDCVRAANMFKQLGIDVLGVVENMSFFVGDDGKTYDLFGRGGAEQMAQRLGLPFLGAVPISMGLRKNSDAGDPSANFESSDGNTPLREALVKVARNLEAQCALAEMRSGAARPTLTIG